MAYKVSSCIAPLLEKAALALTLSVCGRVGIGPCKEPLHSWADSWALAGGSVRWLRSPEAPHSDEDTEGDLLAGVPSFLGLCPPGAMLTNPSGESGLVRSQPPGPPLILSGPCSAEGATPSSAGSSTSGAPPKQSGLERPGCLASKANGVGPKTAARIILELRDKMMKETPSDVLAGKSSSPIPSAPSAPAGGWVLGFEPARPPFSAPTLLLPTLLLLPPCDVSPHSPACSDPHPALLPFLDPLSALPGGARTHPSCTFRGPGATRGLQCLFSTR